MKHPGHHIDVDISTKGCVCPDFDYKVENEVMSCKILGPPGLRWYFISSVDTLEPIESMQATYYLIIFYLEGKIVDGPRIINRRVPSDASSICPDLYGDTKLYFFAKSIVPFGFIEPKDWLIEVRVFECDEHFAIPESSEPPLSAARTMLNRSGKIYSPKLQRACNFDSRRLIVHYKFEYRCAGLLPGCPTWGDMEQGWNSEDDSEDDSEEDFEGTSRPVPGQSVISFHSAKDKDPEPLPEYSWGPQPKGPPSWEQKLTGRDLIRWGNVLNKGISRARSPLGEIASDVEGLSIRTKKRVALQRVLSPTKPMIPRFPRQGSDRLPPGWEVRYTNTYKTYYVNHKHKYTTWQNPLQLGSTQIPLDAPKELDNPLSEKLLSDKPETPDIISVDNKDNGELGDQLDEEMDIDSYKGGCPTPTYKLKTIFHSIGSLWLEQAQVEADIQKHWLSGEESSRWLDTYQVEHWFPKEEKFEPIIETINTCVLTRGLLDALHQRVKIMDKMKSLVEEATSLDESIPLTILGPVNPAVPAAKPAKTATDPNDSKPKQKDLEKVDDSQGQDNTNADGRVAQASGWTTFFGGPVKYQETNREDLNRDRVAKLKGHYDEGRSTGGSGRVGVCNMELSSLKEGGDTESLPGKVSQTTADDPMDDAIENDGDLEYALKLSLQVDAEMEYTEDLEYATQLSREEPPLSPASESVFPEECGMESDDALYAPPPGHRVTKYVLLLKRPTLVLRGEPQSVTTKGSRITDQALGGENELRDSSPGILDIGRMNLTETMPSKQHSTSPVKPTMKSWPSLPERGSVVNSQFLPSGSEPAGGPSGEPVGGPADTPESAVPSKRFERKGRKRRMTDGLGNGESSGLDVYKKGSYGLRKRNRTV